MVPAGDVDEDALGSAVADWAAAPPAIEAAPESDCCPLPECAFPW
jgi:hypothetical protein